MKNDPLFKFVAAIVIAGAFIALFAPARSADRASAPQVVASAPAGEHPESSE